MQIGANKTQSTKVKRQNIKLRIEKQQRKTIKSNTGGVRGKKSTTYVYMKVLELELPGTGVIGSYELTRGCRELNPAPPEEQPVLIPAESSLQPKQYFQYRKQHQNNEQSSLQPGSVFIEMWYG